MELIEQYLFGEEGCPHKVSTYLRTEPYSDSACVAVYKCFDCGKEYRDE